MVRSVVYYFSLERPFHLDRLVIKTLFPNSLIVHVPYSGTDPSEVLLFLYGLENAKADIVNIVLNVPKLELALAILGDANFAFFDQISKREIIVYSVIGKRDDNSRFHRKILKNRYMLSEDLKSINLPEEKISQWEEVQVYI